MQTTRDRNFADVEKGLFAGLIEALEDKQSQLEINFQRVGLKMPGAQMGVELNGQMSLSVHMRELTDKEKEALAMKNVNSISASN